jgi:hypothetical protein
MGKTGKILKNSLINDIPNSVLITCDLSLSNPDNRVEYELWYSSILDLSAKSLKEMGKYQVPFGADALFTPRILTFNCENCPSFIRKENCVSDGKYCPYRPKSSSEEMNED